MGAEVDLVGVTEDLPITLLREILNDGLCVHESRAGAHARWRAAALWQVETDAPLLERAGRSWLKRVAERGLS
jgi:hypothetical protein